MTQRQTRHLDGGELGSSFMGALQHREEPVVIEPRFDSFSPNKVPQRIDADRMWVASQKRLSNPACCGCFAVGAGHPDGSYVRGPVRWRRIPNHRLCSESDITERIAAIVDATILTHTGEQIVGLLFPNKLQALATHGNVKAFRTPAATLAMLCNLLAKPKALGGLRVIFVVNCVQGLLGDNFFEAFAR